MDCQKYTPYTLQIGSEPNYIEWLISGKND